MTIRVDKRQITAAPEPDAQGRLPEQLAALRNLQIALAQDLARIDRSNAFVYGQPADRPCPPGEPVGACGSIVEYGVKLGFSAFEVRTLTRVGHTLAAHAEAAAMIRDGRLTIEAAAEIGRVLATNALIRPGDNWLTHATTEPLKLLRRRVKERFELHAQGELGLEELHVLITAKARDRFDRARDIASQKAGKLLSEGQTLTRVVDFYLEKHDAPPVESSKRKTRRRVGDTNLLPRSRYIPADVKRAVRARSGGTCEVPGCHRRLGLELAHRTPHARGSGREVEDIGELCHRHHILYDAGRIPWPVAPPDRVSEGVPRLKASVTRVNPPANGPSSASSRSFPQRAQARPGDRRQSPPRRRSAAPARCP